MAVIMDDTVELMDGSALMGATTQPDAPVVKVEIKR